MLRVVAGYQHVRGWLAGWQVRACVGRGRVVVIVYVGAWGGRKPAFG